MFNVRTDFGIVGRLFGVPRAWLSRVGAFCSSFSSAHPIVTINAPDFPDAENNPVQIGINEDALGEFVDARGGEMGEEPVDNTGHSDLDDLSGDRVLPQSGSVKDWQIGEKGLVLQLFAPVKYRSSSGEHIFYPVSLYISKSGKIVKVEFVRNRGIEIGA